MAVNVAHAPKPVPVDDSRLLLVKVAKPSALGRWSLPGGKLEHGETLQQGAAREAQEETGLIVDVEKLFAKHKIRGSHVRATRDAAVAGTHLPASPISVVSASAAPVLPSRTIDL